MVGETARSQTRLLNRVCLQIYADLDCRSQERGIQGFSECLRQQAELRGRTLISASGLDKKFREGQWLPDKPAAHHRRVCNPADRVALDCEICR